MAVSLESIVAMEPTTCKRFVFAFPMASGHINPSLPVARSLVDLGHQVHYLCREQMREAIEDTGAVFHSEVECQPELYKGREPDIWGAMDCLKREHGLQGLGALQGAFRVMAIQMELQLPGLMRFLREMEPSAIVFCPIMNTEAALAARMLGIPAIGLLTTAGPGSGAQLVEGMLGKGPHDELEHDLRTFEPSLAAVERLNANYHLNLDPLSLTWLAPVGHFLGVQRATTTLVTTSEDLQDPMTPELHAVYEADGTSVTFAGPLLDKPGARRAGVHKFQPQEAAKEAAHTDGDAPDVSVLVRAARASGRRVVLVSMGTVVTGDSPQFGWEGRPTGPDGKPRGLTGRELCRSAWAGAFDSFGAGSAEAGALLIVALGPQPDALGDIVPPPNAICMPMLPQVDILKAGVDIFLTHGGQNSFTESLAHGTPVVVCPGFGDQVGNSLKAVDLGVGLKVDRPDPDVGEEAAAMADYRADICHALLTVLREPGFSAAAARCAARLQQAGGVPRAVEVVLRAADRGTMAADVAVPAKVLGEPTSGRLIGACAGA